MATKLQNISELVRQTTERLTQSVDNWKRFLDSAAGLYKYPFMRRDRMQKPVLPSSFGTANSDVG